MKVARVVVEVSADWRVRIAREVGAAAVVPERPLRKVASARGSFPFPPEVVADAEPHADLVRDDTGALALELYRRVTTRDLQSGDVVRYGRWLFDALLGANDFKAIVALAAAERAEVLEIALAWSSTEHELSRLHWEAMRSPEAFLAAGRGLRVAITRLVLGAKHAPRAMASPPRALFVIGGEAFDEGLRPGSELLAVLRSPASTDRRLRGEVMTRATPSRMRSAMARRPDIVHVIAHGSVDAGTCLVELAAEDGEVSGKRSVDQLYAMLSDGTELPAALILSVCEAGRALPLAQTGSFASELVARGVPIVIGMAGRVANVACRLFARRFGEALLAGEPIVVATEEGRRSAFTTGEPPDRSIDWALPALFLAEGVPPDFGTRAAEADPAHARVAAYRVEEQPVFCGRHDVIEAFHSTLARATSPVLVIWSDTRELGRTRVLKELTAEAVRNGHVPCLLWWPPDADAPQTTEALARQLALAIVSTRKIFELAQRVPSTLALLLTRPIETLRTEAALPEELRAVLALSTTVTAEAFQLALADELTALARDARAKHPALGATSRAVVLVDDIQRWDKALSPFLDTLITAYGLGVKDEPVPVVLSFSTAGPAGSLLRPVTEGQRAGWPRVRLDRLRPGEDLLAYQDVLLHPFGDVLPDFSSRRWAFDYDVGEAVVSDVVTGFRETFGGAPNKLGKYEFYVAARFARTSKFVVAASDEDLLVALRTGNR